MYAYKGIKSCNIETANLNLLFQKLHARPLKSSLYGYFLCASDFSSCSLFPCWSTDISGDSIPGFSFSMLFVLYLLNRAAQSNDSAVSRRTSTTVEDQAVRRGGDVIVPGTCPRECIFLQKHAWVGGGSAPALV